MKRTLCLLLALIMIMSSTAALAVAPTISNLNSIHSFFGENGVFNHNVWKPVAEFTLNTTANITSTLYYNGQAFNTPKIDGNYADHLSVDAGKVTLTWPGVDYNGWHPEGTMDNPNYVDFQLDVVAQNDDGQASGSATFNYGFQHAIDQHEPYIPDPDAPVDPLNPTEPAEPVQEFINPYTESRTVTYSHNTVCSFGPHFRNVSPELTDKWYMFTALDLSHDGTQIYEVVGGNTFVIGCVAIDVQGDNVTVTYDYAPGVWGYEEFFTFFHDYDDVTTVNPSEIDEKYEYEKTYSIADDLDGDTSVLLFMCNVATFKSDNKALTFFYENLDERKALRQAMLDMIGKVEVTKPYRVN